MKFNLGSKNKETFNNMIKSAGSAAELFSSHVKKTKTKNCSDLNDINPIGYILTNNDSNNNKAFFSPQNTPGQKIIFLEKDKKKGSLHKLMSKLIMNQRLKIRTVCSIY